MGILDSLGSWQIGGLPAIWWLVPLSSIIALVSAFLLNRSVMKNEEGTLVMIEIANAVREGSIAYLKRQYRVIAIVFGVIFIIFLIMALFGLMSFFVPFAFVLGGLFSAASGLIGMRTATNSSARTAHAANKSLNDALRVAFQGGAVMGLSVVGFALLNISIVFLFLFYLAPPMIFRGDEPLTEIPHILVSCVFGASAVALFARVGGGIFTKAADVGADLVGKVETNIPEDDPRNPATIADNVGDNVGDVAGLGADLYESYIGSVLATVVLGVSATAAQNATDFKQLQYITMPMVLAALGILLSIFCIRLVNVKGDVQADKIIQAMDRGLIWSTAGIGILSFPLFYILQLDNPFLMWLTVIIGLGVGIVVGKTTDFYTSSAHKPTQNIAEHAVMGSATVIIEGLAVGMRSVAIPMVVISMGIVISFFIAGGSSQLLMGLYGVGLAAVGMLSTLGFTLSTDAFGPIADNAGGNAEMSGLPPEVRHRTDMLDAVGNTTAATGKGFAIGSAALTALVLMAAFVDQVHYEYIHLLKIESLEVMGQIIPIRDLTINELITYYDITLFNPAVIAGLFLGLMTVFYFSALTMSAVGRTASDMVAEVRRQFNSRPGILLRTEKPDYARCVDISTSGAQKEMLKPAVLAILMPVVVGVLFGVAGVVALLAGSLSGGFALALMMANSGGAWDNAKKFIEQGAHGGKGTSAHKAAVVGDTVGDPFKDTCGPSLDILIKLMSIVAVIMASFIAILDKGGLLGLIVKLLNL